MLVDICSMMLVTDQHQIDFFSHILQYCLTNSDILSIVETFFRNSSFISNTKSQLAPFTFSIAKRVMFRPCPEGMANSGPNMAIVETVFPQLQFFLQY